MRSRKTLPYEAEFRIRTAIGESGCTTKASCSAIPTAWPIRMIGVSTDVTARKFAESRCFAKRRCAKASRVSEVLADAMPQIVWTARPDGQVDYYNRRWYEFTDTKPGPITDQYLARRRASGRP